MKSVNHLGIHHLGNNALVGVVSNRSGRKSENLINRFHDFLMGRQYLQAYHMFSLDLQQELSLEKFMESLQTLERDYGPEKSFVIFDIPLIRRLSLWNQAIFQDAFTYYYAVVSHYRSERNQSIYFRFAVVREQRTLKISSVNFGEI